MQVKLEFERSTKNTYRYREVGNDEPGLEVAIGTLYIKKAAAEQLGLEWPEDTLLVTLEVE